MKRLYMLILSMVIVLTGVVSSLYATEAEAATSAFKTEANDSKIYFPLNGQWTTNLKLPVKYNKGTLGGKTFYDLNTPLTAVGYSEVYKLEYDKKIVNIKAILNKSTNKTHIVVSPVKKGSTTLKVNITKSGFNKVVFTTKITVTDRELDWTTVPITDIYKTEFTKSESGYLPEYTKLTLFELNKHRTQITIKDKVGSSAYEIKVAEESVKIMNNLSENPTNLVALKLDEEMQELADMRMKQLIKLGKSDNHDGYNKLIENSANYKGYFIAEVLCTGFSYRQPGSIMEAYKRSTAHWAILSDLRVNYVGLASFKTKDGKLMNITMTGTYYEEGMAEKILSLESEYEYLMTPEERDYYGINDLFDDYDNENSSDDYDWSI